MASYALDTDMLSARTTGIVNPVMVWVDDPTRPGKKTMSGEQMTDRETGFPIWEVEIVHASEDFGRAATAKATVQFPHPTEPAFEEFGRAPFTEMWLRVGNTGRVNLVAAPLASASSRAA